MHEQVKCEADKHCLDDHFKDVAKRGDMADSSVTNRTIATCMLCWLC